MQNYKANIVLILMTTPSLFGAIYILKTTGLQSFLLLTSVFLFSFIILPIFTLKKANYDYLNTPKSAVTSLSSSLGRVAGVVGVVLLLSSLLS